MILVVKVLVKEHSYVMEGMIPSRDSGHNSQIISRSCGQLILKFRKQPTTIGAKMITDRIFILGNYLEIGNALPYRKNCFRNYLDR